MATIPKYQIYKVWTSTGVYIGVLKKITTEFKYVQDVNTIGPSSIDIKVAQSGYVAQDPVEMITTEDDYWITTEDDYGLVTEGSPEFVGITGAIIKNGNTITITEFSSYYPNGKVVFTGRMTRWKMNFGTSDDITITVINTATDLNNYLVKGPDVLDTQQTTITSTYNVYENKSGAKVRLAQVVSSSYAGGGGGNISSIGLSLAAENGSNPCTFTVEIWHYIQVSVGGGGFGDQLAGTLLATGSIIVTSTSAANTVIKLNTPVTEIVGQNYICVIKADAGAGFGGFVGYYNAGFNGLYASTDGLTFVTFSHPTYPNSDANVAYIQTYYDGGYTKAQFTLIEPTAMVKQIIDLYNLQGGVVTYTPSSIVASTNQIPAYTFNTNTIKESLDVALDFLPPNYYYYVDGNNILWMKPTAVTADYTFILGKHLQNLDVQASIENVINDVPFTGGPTAGVNLYVRQTDTASKGLYGPGLNRLTDYRVTNSSAGIAKAYNNIQRNKNEAFSTTLVVVDTITDTTLYVIGKTISFENVPSVIAALVLPIVRIERSHGTALLTIGTIPPRQQDRLDQSQQDLLALQTVANPNAPS